MKHLSRHYRKFICVYVGIIFALSLVHWDGAGVFLESSLAESANSAIDLTRDNPGIRRAIEVQKRNEERLMGIPDVVGVGTGIGVKGQPTIRVFTKRAGIPHIPQKLEEIPVEMKVTGMFVAYNDPTDRFARPVPIGVSTGHPAVTAGTLGARVKDSEGNVYALSNNHVYANSNDANIGDSALQPGAADGGVDDVDRIGLLWAYKIIDFSVFGQNTIDAAIVSTTPGEVGNATLPEGYGIPNSTIFGDVNSDGIFDNLSALLQQSVQKFGRTTGLTNGQVTAINVTANVCYANCESEWFAYLARFVDQIVIESGSSVAFSLGGDSGSLIVTDDVNKNPVGLLFAGSSTSTLANRIDLVLNEFDVSIDDSQPTVPENEVCDNGDDDDGDGLTDCADPDCASDPVCISATETQCANGVDDDGDGLSDCADPDCEVECAVHCFKGVVDGNCNPKKDGALCPDCIGTNQPGNEVCDNGEDDDLDGLEDCADQDCFDDPACENGGCLRKGSICTSDNDCCSGICRGVKCK